ncbi:hypothetical protein PoB_004231200 [Plakobranchus ocellatus]|uniref:Transmembrane protein n=1 Tax=Plakobranchus ocellatus TaxID=259542 RepID=A0AAV4B9D2_9GAST|nr:hypothetical protein PoB_004231200 [Plakobranchus ocellatus]
MKKFIGVVITIGYLAVLAFQVYAFYFYLGVALDNYLWSLINCTQSASKLSPQPSLSSAPSSSASSSSISSELSFTKPSALPSSRSARPISEWARPSFVTNFGETDETKAKSRAQYEFPVSLKEIHSSSGGLSKVEGKILRNTAGNVDETTGRRRSDATTGIRDSGKNQIASAKIHTTNLHPPAKSGLQITVFTGLESKDGEGDVRISESTGNHEKSKARNVDNTAEATSNSSRAVTYGRVGSERKPRTSSTESPDSDTTPAGQDGCKLELGFVLPKVALCAQFVAGFGIGTSAYLAWMVGVRRQGQLYHLGVIALVSGNVLSGFELRHRRPGLTEGPFLLPSLVSATSSPLAQCGLYYILSSCPVWSLLHPLLLRSGHCYILSSCPVWSLLHPLLLPSVVFTISSPLAQCGHCYILSSCAVVIATSSPLAQCGHCYILSSYPVWSLLQPLLLPSVVFTIPSPLAQCGHCFILSSCPVWSLLYPLLLPSIVLAISSLPLTPYGFCYILLPLSSIWPIVVFATFFFFPLAPCGLCHIFLPSYPVWSLLHSPSFLFPRADFVHPLSSLLPRSVFAVSYFPLSNVVFAVISSFPLVQCGPCCDLFLPSCPAWPLL